MDVEKLFGGSSPLWPGWFAAGVAGVDIFFVISGFVMVHVTRGKFRDRRSIAAFLFGRVTRIYPLYWFFCLVLAAAFLAKGSSALAETGVAASLLLWPQNTPPFLAVAWTLSHEMYFYLAFAVLMTLPEKHLLKGLAVWMAGAAVSREILIGAGLLEASPALRLITHPLTLEFVLGCLVALQVLPSRVSGKVTFTAGAALLLAAAAFHWAVTPGSVPGGWARAVTYGVPAALILDGAVRMERRSGTLLPRFLRRAGDASYALYLCHVIVFLVTGHLALRVFGKGTVPYGLLSLLMLLAVAAAGTWSHLYVERPVVAAARRARGKILGV